MGFGETLNWRIVDNRLQATKSGRLLFIPFRATYLTCRWDHKRLKQNEKQGMRLILSYTLERRGESPTLI